MAQMNIGIAGLGVVGAKTAQLLLSPLHAQNGTDLSLRAVSARNKDADRGFSLDGIDWHDDARELAARDDIDIIVELIGGSDGIALELVSSALRAGKHVVTANKAMIAHHGFALAELAETQNVSLLFEAGVAGGIPALKLIREGLAANHLSRITGILNGTSNFILSEMTATGRPFAAVLAEAQEKGFAEADPSFDIDGVDAAHKLSILAALGFGEKISFDAVQCKGIRAIDKADIAFAGEFDYTIKLLGIAERGGMRSVQPCLISNSHAIAHINGAMNAVCVEAEPVNIINCSGPGAGAGPTASAVLSDLIDIAHHRTAPVFGVSTDRLEDAPEISAAKQISKFYIRMLVSDRAGVLSDITAILKELDISVESMLQRGQPKADTVTLVMTTHQTSLEAIEKAQARLAKADFVTGDIMVLSIIDANELR